MLDVRRLRVLREVALSGSLTRAAEALSYSPSAVSQHIAALERETGAVLLERRSRGVGLTEAGRLLVGHAATILAELDAAERALAELGDLRRGRLRMASFATASASVLPQAVDAFHARHPDIEISVKQASPQESVALLQQGELDVALTVDLDPFPADGVDVVHLFDDHVRLALHRDHRLARATELRLEDLAREAWIDVPRRTSGGKVLRRACEDAGFEPRVIFESDDYTAIQELVGTGAGIALIPDLALCPPHDAVVLRRLEPAAPCRHVQAAVRPLPYRSPAASAMLRILAEQRPSAREQRAQRLAATPPNR